MKMPSGYGRHILAVAPLAAILAAFFSLGALMSEPDDSPRAGREVVVLSPHWEGITKEFNRGFALWMRERHGIDAHVRHIDVGGGTGKILRHIESSFRATPDSIGVDIIFGGGTAAHQSLAERGFLERIELPPGVMEGVARDVAGMPLHDADGYWYGAALSGFGIISNRRVVERMGLPEVRDWADLTNPRLYGWIASGDPTSSGAVRANYEVILQAHGFETGYGMILQIAGNVPAFDEGGSSPASAVARGQAAYGLSIDFYAWDNVAAIGEESVGFTLPDRHTVITPDPIAVMKGAPNRDLAEKFVEFVLSTEGQKLWYLEMGEEGGPKRYALRRLPVRRSLYSSGLRSSVAVDPFRWGGGLDFDPELERRRSRIFSDLVRATVLDVHDELRAAWRAVIDAGEPDELIASFRATPVTGTELLRLGAEDWADPTLRAETMVTWSSFAREKFARVRKEAAGR